ncbi:MAG: hypothetical protein IJ779_06420 [Ruminococcus sp.]|nr:hypothetical protein [Ruminococcus sp.]
MTCMQVERLNRHDFRYVTKKEALPLKKELIALINEVQDNVRKYFTFDFKFIGSSSRNMITYDAKGNTGFDFDVNIEPNTPEKYKPCEIHKIIFNALRKYAAHYGYLKVEESTSVITIKVIENNRIKYSCDFAIVHHYYKDGKKRQEYIKFDKYHRRYLWNQRENDYYLLGNRINWLKKNDRWGELREYYISKKNKNNDPDKHSRSIYAESIKEMCDKYGYKVK